MNKPEFGKMAFTSRIQKEVGAIIIPFPTKEEIGIDILRNLPKQDTLILS